MPPPHPPSTSTPPQHPSYLLEPDLCSGADVAGNLIIINALKVGVTAGAIIAATAAAAAAGRASACARQRACDHVCGLYGQLYPETLRPTCSDDGSKRCISSSIHTQALAVL